MSLVSGSKDRHRYGPLFGGCRFDSQLERRKSAVCLTARPNYSTLTTVVPSQPMARETV